MVEGGKEALYFSGLVVEGEFVADLDALGIGGVGVDDEVALAVVFGEVVDVIGGAPQLLVDEIFKEGVWILRIRDRADANQAGVNHIELFGRECLGFR